MSEDAAQAIEEYYQEWDDRERRHGFIERMEHKLHAKEQHSGRR